MIIDELREALSYDPETGIGSFASAELAHEAYKLAAIKLHGEFANHG